MENQNNEKTELELSGLNPEELEFMDIEERKAALEAAGLDPQKYDFQKRTYGKYRWISHNQINQK